MGETEWVLINALTFRGTVIDQSTPNCFSLPIRAYDHNPAPRSTEPGRC